MINSQGNLHLNLTAEAPLHPSPERQHNKEEMGDSLVQNKVKVKPSIAGRCCCSFLWRQPCIPICDMDHHEIQRCHYPPALPQRVSHGPGAMLSNWAARQWKQWKTKLTPWKGKWRELSRTGATLKRIILLSFSWVCYLSKTILEKKTFLCL